MVGIGEVFQEARLRKGVTLAEAGEATKIHPRYLAALEEGDYTSLPEAVYARGFIRNYAAYLGLDGEKLLRLHYGRRSRTRPSRTVVPSKTKPLKTNVRFAPSLAAVLFVVILAAVLLIWSYSAFVVPAGESTQAIETAVGGEPTASSGGGLPAGVTTPAGASTPGTANASPAAGSPQPETTAQAGATSATQVDVKLSAEADAWMLVKIDGQQVFNGTMPVGSYRVFRGGREVAVWTTNAPHVEVEINGTKIGALGPESVGHKAWVNQNGQIVETIYQ